MQKAEEKEDNDGSKKFGYFNEPFFIALAIIIPFIAITIWLIASDSLEFFKELASVWGVWVGTVLGYYFGSRPVESLTRRVETLIDDFDDSVEDSEAELDNANNTIDELEGKYDKAVKDIQYIVLKYPTALEKPLIERLKTDYEVII